MIISALFEKNITYISVHAEQAFTGAFLADRGDSENDISIGIESIELTRETLINIRNYASEKFGKFSLALDFTRIRDAQANLQKTIIELKSAVDLLVLTNISVDIVHKLGIDLYTINQPDPGGIYTEFYLTDKKDKLELQNVDELFNRYFIESLKRNTRNSPIEEAHRYASPIYIPNFVDIKGLMVSEPSFFMYVLYLLAIKISEREDWSCSSPQPTLFCQNLNGSYIASVLSSFLNWDILSMDHIGPVNKVYSNIGSKINADSRYIVVSDMICMGTEIRICQNIINYSGGIYIGNVSIVKVQTLNPEHQEGNNISIFQLTKKNNPIDFKILTALDI